MLLVYSVCVSVSALWELPDCVLASTQACVVSPHSDHHAPPKTSGEKGQGEPQQHAGGSIVSITFV